MKKLIPYLVLVVVFVFLYIQNSSTTEYIYEIDGNTKKDPLPVFEIKKDKKVFCSECNMMVKKMRNSAQVVTPKGKTYFFNDVGCMIRWINEQKKYDEKELTMYVFVPECSCYIGAHEAWYVRDGITPLGYGVQAFGTYMEAQRSDMIYAPIEFGYTSRKQDNESQKDVYEYDEVKKFILRGETLLHPLVRKKLLKN